MTLLWKPTHISDKHLDSCYLKEETRTDEHHFQMVQSIYQNEKFLDRVLIS
jgi:hypothetical protein